MSQYNPLESALQIGLIFFYFEDCMFNGWTGRTTWRKKKMETEKWKRIFVYIQQHFFRLWQRNGYMGKGRENDNEMEDEEGEMVKWRDTMDTMDKRKIERETDWELTQSGETPALIRVGSPAACCHCVGGRKNNGRWQFLDRGLALVVGNRWSSPRATRSSFLDAP